ncbi:MAG: FHA domain-containing protein [Candidatus Eisenbacteria bacterium]
MSSVPLGLEITTPGSEPRRLTFAAGPITLGREAENSIVLTSGKCSARHAAIEAVDDGWLLTDSSAHGTEYNGLVLRWGERVRLAHGDLLKIGDAELLVSFEQASSGASPAAPPTLGSPTSSASAPAIAPPAPASSPLERLMGAPRGDLLPPRLHFFQSGEFVRELALGEEGVSILVGRDPACEIAVPDPFRVVSKRHARIYRTWGGAFLEDLSQHGVYLNGERVQNIVALSHGDRVTLSTVAQGSWGPVLIFLEEAEANRAAEATKLAKTRALEQAPAAPESAQPAPAEASEPRAAASSAPVEAAGASSASSAPTDFAALLDQTARAAPAASRGDSKMLVYVALGVAAIAVLGLVIGTILFFGKP